MYNILPFFVSFVLFVCLIILLLYVTFLVSRFYFDGTIGNGAHVYAVSTPVVTVNAVTAVITNSNSIIYIIIIVTTLLIWCVLFYVCVCFFFSMTLLSTFDSDIWDTAQGDGAYSQNKQCQQRVDLGLRRVNVRACVVLKGEQRETSDRKAMPSVETLCLDNTV